jgi:hypothetical protein
VLWGVAFILTVLRGVLRWRSRHKIFGDDHFGFLGLLSLTGLSAVITCLLPQFHLAGAYSKAFIEDPQTPLPLPPVEFVERNKNRSQVDVHSNASSLDHIVGWEF